MSPARSSKRPAPQGEVVDGVELVLLPSPEAGLFYGVTDPDDVAWMADRLTGHPWRCFEQPLEPDRTRRRCGRSRSTTSSAASTLATRDPELMEKARAANRLWEIDTGHDLMITEPAAVTAARSGPCTSHRAPRHRPARPRRSGGSPPRLSRRRVDATAGRGTGRLVRARGLRAVLGDHQARRHHRHRVAAGAVLERARADARRRIGAPGAADRDGRDARPAAPRAAASASRCAGSRRARSASRNDEIEPHRARGARRHRGAPTAAEEFDFVEHVAAPLPIAVIAWFLGVPREDRRAAVPLDQRGDRQGRPRVPPAGRDARARPSAGPACEMHALPRRADRARAARDPGDDIVSELHRGRDRRRAAHRDAAALVLRADRRSRQRDHPQRDQRRAPRVLRAPRPVGAAPRRSRPAPRARSRRCCAT